MGKTTLTKEILDKVKELHDNGMSERGIARELGMSPATIHTWIRKHIKCNGEIKKPTQTKTEKKKEEIIINDTPVKCNCSLAKACIYGKLSCNSDSDKCNFMAVTHKSRIALQPKIGHTPTCKHPYTECYFYQKVTRENKRRKVAQ